MRYERLHATLLFLALFLCYAYFFPRWADWNQNSRLNLTFALIEKNSIVIDDYHQNTGDKLFYRGRYYSDKAPGLSFAAAPFYAMMKPILDSDLMISFTKHLSNSPSFAATLNPSGTGVNSDKVKRAIAQYLLTIFLIGLPSAAVGVLLFHYLALIVISPRSRLVLTLAYGLGTAAFPYSTVFYSHQPTGVLTFLAFVLAYKALPQDNKIWLAIGCLLGAAVLMEYPTVLAAGAIWLYVMLKHRSWRASFIVVLTMAPFALIVLLYNYARFGSVMEFGYAYHATFTRHAQAGFVGLAGFTPQSFALILFSEAKGLIFRSPFLLFYPIALYWLWKRKGWRLEAVCSLLVVCGYLWYASSFYDPGGGHTAGPRYLVGMLPFACFPLATLRSSRLIWATLCVLVLISIGMTFAETVAGQHFPDQALLQPFSDYVFPSLARGDLARNVGTLIGFKSWASLLPLFVALLAGLVVWAVRQHSLRRYYGIDRSPEQI